jgi:limonene-1,2-epoxide hydrolase
MSESPEAVVRRFFDAWVDPKLDELRGFFADGAVWVDGPQGVRRGADSIAAEITSQLTAVGGVTVDLVTQLSDGRTVMVELVSRSKVGDTAISTVVMAVFEFDDDGRIAQWREAYDLKSMLDQVTAALKMIQSGKPKSATTPWSRPAV